jgi:hypothetical protein
MPAPIDPAQQAVLDDEHLRLLTIGFYVSAAVTAFFSLIGLFYAAMGFFIGTVASNSARNVAEGSQGAENAAAPAFIGALFGIIGLVIFVVALAFAGAKVYAAVCLKRRRGRTFCLVVAAISCLEMPWGTLLGVFTIIVLERPTVSRQFLPINAVAPRSPLPPYIPPAAGL